MSGKLTEETGLADFLRDVRRGRAPVELISDGGARALRNVQACTPQQAAELARVSDRPPPGMVIHKHGSRSVVGRHVLTDGTPVVLKYYYPKNVAKQFSQSVLGTRCERSWLAALALCHLGLPVPPAMYVTEKRLLRGLWFDRALLATAEAPGITLTSWVHAHEADEPRLGLMATRLLALFSKMARYHVAHGDLKATNLIIDDDDTVRLVDLDAVTLLPSPARWKAARERDRRIFLGNWKPGSPAHAAFSSVFDEN